MKAICALLILMFPFNKCTRKVSSLLHTNYMSTEKPPVSGGLEK